jgi:hypothetical protein
MTRHRLTVVLSQAQGKHPVKQALEESIVAGLLGEPGTDVSVIPYLYGIDPGHTARLFLESVLGDMVVLAWSFPRAAFWVLDRDGIKGHYGESQLQPEEDDDEDLDENEEAAAPQGIGALDVPDRWIHCIDLRASKNAADYIEEIRRIAAECRQRQETAPPKANATPTAALVELGLGQVKGPETNGNGQ